MRIMPFSESWELCLKNTKTLFDHTNDSCRVMKENIETRKMDFVGTRIEYIKCIEVFNWIKLKKIMVYKHYRVIFGFPIKLI